MAVMANAGMAAVVKAAMAAMANAGMAAVAKAVAGAMASAAMNRVARVLTVHRAMASPVDQAATASAVVSAMARVSGASPIPARWPWPKA